MMYIAGYLFEGPYAENSNWAEVPAVYVPMDSYRRYLDVGQSVNIRARLPQHERRSCWTGNAIGGISFAIRVVYNEEERRIIESTIRRSYNLQ